MALPVDPGLSGAEYDQTIYGYFGFSPTSFQVALIFIIGGLGVMSSIIFKNLADRYGRRPLYMITATGFVTFSVLTAFVPPGIQYFPLFLFIRFIASMFLAADLVIVIMAEEAPNKSRGRLVGLTVSINALGLAAAVMVHFLDIRILNFNSWQSLLFLSGLGFFFIIPIYFKMKETNRFTKMQKYQNWKRERGLKVKQVSWRDPLQKKYMRPFMISVISGIGGAWIMAVAVTWVPMFYMNELLLEDWELFLLPLALTGFGSFLVVLYFMDRWGRREIVIRGALITFFGGLLIGVPAPFCHPPGRMSLTDYLIADPYHYNIIMTLRPILIPVIVSGFCIALIGAVLMLAGIGLMPLEMVPPQMLSTAQGWWITFTRVGMILSPFVSFWGAVQIGRTSPDIFDPGGLTFGSSFLLMGIFLIVITFTIIYLAPEKGMAKQKAIEEILSAMGKENPLKREKSRRYEYSIIILCFIVYYSTSVIYGLTLGNAYYGFDATVAVFLVAGIYTLIAGVMIAIVIYAREKWIGVEKYSPKKGKKQKKEVEVSSSN